MADYTFSSVKGPDGETSVSLGGINNEGETVGSYYTGGAQGTTYALSSIDGVSTKIDVPFSQDGYATASGISNSGEIVGNYVASVSKGQPVYQGFVDNGGALTTINAGGDGVSTLLSGVNSSGTIVGYTENNGIPSSFIDKNGTFTSLNAPDATFTEANGITDAGIIFGSYDDSNGVGRGFVDNGGSFSEVTVPGSTFTSVTGINAAGDIVGFYDAANSEQAHGFIDKDGTFTTIDAPGAQSTYLAGLNDAGQISGNSILSSPNSSTFDGEGFIATPVCFVSATLIHTARGNIAVEHLAVGDLALTASGAARPIRWLGHRTIDCRRHPHPAEVMPVRIAAHAFGPNRPARDLYVSPGHAICVEMLGGEVLVPAGSLVNGSTVRQIEVDTVTYWHVELDSHDILLAENLPAESYLEMGNRSFFAEARVPVLHAVPDVKRTHADFCRPFLADGPSVDAIRQRLTGRAARIKAAKSEMRIAC